MRKAAKRDKNETEIIKALRKKGAFVQPLSAPGVPDLLVFYNGKWALIEVKDKGGALTEKQTEWHAACPVEIPIVFTADQAIATIERL